MSDEAALTASQDFIDMRSYNFLAVESMNY